jgi:ATP-dependent DNA helicase DinG
MSNENFRKRNCKYRTFLKDYKVNNKGTREEEVFINSNAKNHYQKNRKVVRASDLFESDKEIENYFSGRGPSSFGKEPGRELGEELVVEVIRDRERLTRAINNILSNPKNWIVSEIKKEGYEVTGG